MSRHFISFFFFFFFLIIPPRQPKLQTMSIILIGSMLFWVSNSFKKKRKEFRLVRDYRRKTAPQELRRCGLLSLIIYHQQRCHSLTEKSFVTFTIQKVTCVYSRRKEFRFFFCFCFRFYKEEEFLKMVMMKFSPLVKNLFDVI